MLNVDNHINEIMLEEYRTLRAEILQSTKIQHKIYTAEATTIFGSVIGIAALKNFSPSLTPYVFLGIPLIFIIFTSLWITEQTRMMRAGDYIQMLENVLNKENDNICLFWENSLRLKITPRFSQVQYKSQIIGIIGSFLFVSLFSIWSIWSYKVASDLILYMITIAYLIFIGYIIYLIISVTSHRKGSNIEEFLDERERYIKQLRKYRDFEFKNQS